jgi:hypothetical protein
MALPERIGSPGGATNPVAAGSGLPGGGARGFGEPDAGSGTGAVSAEGTIGVGASPARVVSLAVLKGSSIPEATLAAPTKVLSLGCASRKKAMPKKTPMVAAAIRPTRRR